MKRMKLIAITCGIALGVCASALRIGAEPATSCGGPAMGAGLVTGPAMGGPPIGPPPFGGGGGLEPEPGMQFGLVLRGVGLTEEQQTRVRAIMDGHRPALQKLFGQLRSTNDAMADRLFVTTALDANDFDADVKTVTGLREQLMREGLAVALELRQVLTPEQLEKASSVSRRMKELQGEMRTLLGNPAGMPPPP